MSGSKRKIPEKMKENPENRLCRAADVFLILFVSCHD